MLEAPTRTGIDQTKNQRILARSMGMDFGLTEIYFLPKAC